MNLAVAGSLVSSLLVVHHDSGSREVQADCLCRMILMTHIFLLLWMMLIQIPGQGMFGSYFIFPGSLCTHVQTDFFTCLCNVFLKQHGLPLYVQWSYCLGTFAIHMSKSFWFCCMHFTGVVVGRTLVIRQVPHPINHKTLRSVILSTCWSLHVHCEILATQLIHQELNLLKQKAQVPSCPAGHLMRSRNLNLSEK